MRLLFKTALVPALVYADSLIDQKRKRGCATDSCNSILDVCFKTAIKQKSQGSIFKTERTGKRLEFDSIGCS